MKMKGDKGELTFCEKNLRCGYRLGGLCEIFLRLMATLTTLGAAILMGLEKQNIDLYGIDIYAIYCYMPALTFFVVANATGAVYGLLSLAVYYISNVKGHLQSGRKWLFFFDLIMTLVITSGISAASAIWYIALEGNNDAGWMKICYELEIFCHRAEDALFASAVGLFIFIGLTLLSAASLSNLSKISPDDSTRIIKV